MCELCDLEHKTKWIFENDSFIICDCLTCSIPLVVLKRHSMELGSAELVHLINVLYELFGGFYHLRFDQRKIKDHWHCHIITQ